VSFRLASDVSRFHLLGRVTSVAVSRTGCRDIFGNELVSLRAHRGTNSDARDSHPDAVDMISRIEIAHVPPWRRSPPANRWSRSSLWSVEPHLHRRVPGAHDRRRGNLPGGPRTTARVGLRWCGDAPPYRAPKRADRADRHGQPWNVHDIVALAAKGRLPETMWSTARRTWAPASLRPSRAQSGAASPTDPRGSHAAACRPVGLEARVAPRRRLGR
jgi:hypothetical protein